MGYLGVGGGYTIQILCAQRMRKKNEHTVEAVEATKELSKQIVLLTTILKSEEKKTGRC